MHIVTTIAAVFLSLTSPGLPEAQVAAKAAASGGVFEVALWPGEGRPRLVAGATTLRPRTEPRMDAPAGKPLHLTQGQRLEFAETVYRTLVPGRLRVRKDAEVRGRRLGSIRRLSKDDYYSDRYPPCAVAVRPGEVIEYLQYRAESSCFVRVRGEVIDAEPCPHFVIDVVDRFAVEAEPRTEWWVQVIVEGQPRGWLLVDGKNVREAGRTF